MPIVMAELDGGRFEFLPYVALRSGRLARVAAVPLHCVAPMTKAPAMVAPRRTRSWVAAAAAAAATVSAAAGLFFASHGDLPAVRTRSPVSEETPILFEAGPP
ncbi:MAG: hypothetical protein KIT25_17055 [Enhydrobacter sp.]|nr:MAG: hypothetical protein KIT25_17055 [Enhydrobacter sp.]